MNIYTDVRDLRLKPGEYDVIVGSPPCQDISTANSRAEGIDGARSGLFFEATRLVRECRPYWGAFENSPAARVRGIDRVLKELEAMDYACWPAVVGADDIGAPHERKRMWLVFADPTRVGCGSRWARGSVASASREPQPERAFQNAIADPDRTGLEVWEGERGDARAQQPTVGRGFRTGDDPHPDQGRQPEQSQRHGQPLAGQQAPRWYDALGLGAWSDWNGGPPDRSALDHGLSAADRRRWIAAYGDAVVPQIAAEIGRAMTACYPQARTVLDLFAGAAGGWSLGMTWAGYDIAGACEVDDWRREQLRRDDLVPERRDHAASASQRRAAREEWLRALGFEEPSNERRKEQLAKNVALMDWPKR